MVVSVPGRVVQRHKRLTAIRDLLKLIESVQRQRELSDSRRQPMKANEDDSDNYKASRSHPKLYRIHSGSPLNEDTASFDRSITTLPSHRHSSPIQDVLSFHDSETIASKTSSGNRFSEQESLQSNDELLAQSTQAEATANPLRHGSRSKDRNDHYVRNAFHSDDEGDDGDNDGRDPSLLRQRKSSGNNDLHVRGIRRQRCLVQLSEEEPDEDEIEPPAYLQNASRPVEGSTTDSFLSGRYHPLFSQEVVFTVLDPVEDRRESLQLTHAGPDTYGHPFESKRSVDSKSTFPSLATPSKSYAGLLASVEEPNEGVSSGASSTQSGSPRQTLTLTPGTPSDSGDTVRTPYRFRSGAVASTLHSLPLTDTPPTHTMVSDVSPFTGSVESIVRTPRRIGLHSNAADLQPPQTGRTSLSGLTSLRSSLELSPDVIPFMPNSATPGDVGPELSRLEICESPDGSSCSDSAQGIMESLAEDSLVYSPNNSVDLTNTLGGVQSSARRNSLELLSPVLELSVIDQIESVTREAPSDSPSSVEFSVTPPVSAGEQGDRCSLPTPGILDSSVSSFSKEEDDAPGEASKIDRSLGTRGGTKKYSLLFESANDGGVSRPLSYSGDLDSIGYNADLLKSPVGRSLRKPMNFSEGSCSSEDELELKVESQSDNETFLTPASGGDSVSVDQRKRTQFYTPDSPLDTQKDWEEEVDLDLEHSWDDREQGWNSVEDHDKWNLDTKHAAKLVCDGPEAVNEFLRRGSEELDDILPMVGTGLVKKSITNADVLTALPSIEDEVPVVVSHGVYSAGTGLLEYGSYLGSDDGDGDEGIDSSTSTKQLPTYNARKGGRLLNGLETAHKGLAKSVARASEQTDEIERAWGQLHASISTARTARRRSSGTVR